jgi:hypothetical protein
MPDTTEYDALFAAPGGLAGDGQGVFRSRTWHLAAAALMLGGIAVFGLILGPLFLLGVVTPADGDPEHGRSGGIGLTCGSLLIAMLALPVLFRWWARRQPVVRPYGEGVLLRLVGRSSLDRVPLVPGLVRVAWAVLSGQGLRVQSYRVPWDELTEVTVAGVPMARMLVVQWLPPATGGALEVSFAQDEFAYPPTEVASALRRLKYDRKAREGLPSWVGAS